MKVTAKCMNHSGCLKAYRGEAITLDAGAPLICPECGKPLTTVGGGSAQIIKIAAIGIGVLVIAAGAFFGVKAFTKGRGTVENNPTPTPDSTPAPIVETTPDTPA